MIGHRKLVWAAFKGWSHELHSTNRRFVGRCYTDRARQHSRAVARKIIRAKTARLVPIERPGPDLEEATDWRMDCCDDGCMCADCTLDRDPDGLMNYGAPPERQPACDLPGCPMCFAARKWLPEKDGGTLNQWRRDRKEMTDAGT